MGLLQHSLSRALGGSLRSVSEANQRARARERLCCSKGSSLGNKVPYALRSLHFCGEKAQLSLFTCLQAIDPQRRSWLAPPSLGEERLLIFYFLNYHARACPSRARFSDLCNFLQTSELGNFLKGQLNEARKYIGLLPPSSRMDLNVLPSMSCSIDLITRWNRSLCNAKKCMAKACFTKN